MYFFVQCWARVQSRNRQAETSSASFFNRDYLAAVDRHYAAWLMPGPEENPFPGAPTPCAVLVLNNENLDRFGVDFAYKISIINTDMMNIYENVVNLARELRNILLVRLAGRGENNE